MARPVKRNSAPSRPGADDAAKKYRNFPKHSLESALVLAQKIQDELGGQPMKRLLLADALGISPGSTNFRDLLSSSNKYGLTEGNEKSNQISLKPTGAAATQQTQPTARIKALREAILAPSTFGRFYKDFANKKLPSADMLPKVLQAQYEVPKNLVAECAKLIAENGRFADIIRDISGSPHILLDAEATALPRLGDEEEQNAGDVNDTTNSEAPPTPQGSPKPATPSGSAASTGPRPIFVGHGKNKGPLQELERLLTTFQIAHKVVIREANLGRPIPVKVREAIQECGSAILIFTRDEKFFDEDDKEVWRPSENVVHELGATSYVYGDRIVIFKEKGVNFPTNFSSIGYIEFESGDLTARTADLLKELIGFGLVKVTPTQ